MYLRLEPIPRPIRNLEVLALGGVFLDRSGKIAPMFRAACVGVVLLILPSPAFAQRDAFVEALAGFTAAVPRTYGDEGVATRASLGQMERGLAEWDRTEREYESNIRTIAP